MTHSFIIFKIVPPINLLLSKETEEILQRIVGIKYASGNMMVRGQRAMDSPRYPFMHSG